jgi:hypothetical protein
MLILLLAARSMGSSPTTPLFLFDLRRCGLHGFGRLAPGHHGGIFRPRRIAIGRTDRPVRLEDPPALVFNQPGPIARPALAGLAVPGHGPIKGAAGPPSWLAAVGRTIAMGLWPC